MTEPSEPTEAHEAPTLGEPAGSLADLLGGGLPDISSLVDGLSAVQSIQSSSFEGTSGGGLVKIRANGRMEVDSVTISPEALADGTDVELLADLVQAALRDLTARIGAAQQQAMGPLGGLLGQ